MYIVGKGSQLQRTDVQTLVHPPPLYIGASGAQVSTRGFGMGGREPVIGPPSGLVASWAASETLASEVCP
jgi:hypothetical protein